MDTGKTFTTADGTRIAYRLLRPGTPRRTLLLLHGLASNHTRWSEFTSTTRLAAGWDILSPDLRGHGGSLFRGRIDMKTWCDDLEELLAVEGVTQAVVVGHCLGANLALWFAQQAPRQVSGLVLIEPMFRAALTGHRTQLAALRPLFAALVPPLRLLAALGLHRHRLEQLDLAALDREARAAMAATGHFPEARYNSVLEDLRSLPTSTYLQGLLAVTGPLPALASIAAPTLSLLSAGGRFSDPEATARLLAPLPQGRILRIPALHWIPTEQPQLMRVAIEAWCDELGARSGA
ncbi:MAG: alpha/beta hydrolase [Burkholderiales bacterium]|nr:alpha/beta hydrolase [Burkholderiales bacterium]